MALVMRPVQVSEAHGRQSGLTVQLRLLSSTDLDFGEAIWIHHHQTIVNCGT